MLLGGIPKQWYSQRSTFSGLAKGPPTATVGGPKKLHRQETYPKADGENGDTGELVEVQPLLQGSLKDT